MFKDKLVFISAPYSSDNSMVKEARFKQCCVACGIVINEGGYPLSPVVHGVPIVNEMKLRDDFEFWKAYCDKLLVKSDIVVVLALEGWALSTGVRTEIAMAKELGKEVHLAIIMDGRLFTRLYETH